MLRTMMDSNQRAKAQDYCVLIGNTLTSYASVDAYRRGDDPTSEVRIVGASAWNPPSFLRRTPSRGALSPLTNAGAAAAAAATSSGSSSPTPNSPSTKSSTSADLDFQQVSTSELVAIAANPPSGPPTFRIVTYAGTHIYCSAPTPADRDMWLAALHSGLEASYASYQETLSSITASPGGSVLKREILPLNLTGPMNTINQDRLLSPPRPHRAAKAAGQAKRWITSAAALTSSSSTASAPISSHGYAPPYETTAPLSNKYCISCGRYPPEPAMKIASVPLPHYGMEQRADVCQDCLISQGVLRHVNSIAGLYAADAHERAALTRARDLAVRAVEDAVRLEKKTDHHLVDTTTTKSGGGSSTTSSEESGYTATTEGEVANSQSTAGTPVSSGWTKVEATTTTSTSEATPLPPPPPSSLPTGDLLVEGEEEDALAPTTPAALSASDGSWTNLPTTNPNTTNATSSSWIDLPPSPHTTTALLHLLSSSHFATYRRRSRILDLNCRMLETGKLGCAAEFLEILQEHAREATASSTVGWGDEVGMKKEAFKVAGDMGAAIKLLHDYALPRKRKVEDETPPRRSNTEMLTCVLEFLLDLCEEGELESVAFFWDQLRQIHLQMLPPLDAGSLVRVELVEDFLLTVCVRYSVHLALELVWGCVADLEESLGSPASATPASLRRRFALLRFVSELESLLFDFDGGWGGGSVSLRSMLSPSQHQAALIKEAMSVLQLHRRFGSHHLTRSVRLDKLRKEAERAELELSGQNILLQDSDDDDNDDEEDGMKTPRSSKRKSQYIPSPTDEARQKLRIARNADYFSSQLMFTRRLGDIAERLRFMDVEKRRPALERELDILNSSGRMGGDPMNRLTHPDDGHVHVVHVPSREGHVFRSKERTPVLLLMEVMKEESTLQLLREEEEKEKGIVAASMSGLTLGENDESVEPAWTGDDDKEKGQVLDLDSAEAATGPPDLVADNEESNVLATPKLGKLKRLENSSSMDEDKETETKENADDGDKNDGTATGVGSVLSSPQRATMTPQDKAEMKDLVANMMTSLDMPNVVAEGGDVGKETTTTTTKGGGHDNVNTEKVSKEKEGDLLNDGSNTPNPNEAEAAPKKPDPPGSTEPPQQNSAKSKSPAVTSLALAPRKISVFGSLSGAGEHSSSAASSSSSSSSAVSNISSLAARGEGRREVLTTIFVKGMKGGNLIAKGAAPALQRSLQAFDRQRAEALMKKSNSPNKRTTMISSFSNDAASRDDSSSLDDMSTAATSSATLAAATNDGGSFVEAAPSEEDETMESLRLLLIQSRVAQGNLSLENAAKVLAPVAMKGSLARSKSKGQIIMADRSGPVDAGDIDPRLAGCGPLSQTVLSAMELWQSGTCSNSELLELVQKDLQFLKHAGLPSAENATKLMEDSAFWGRFAFGERWAEKKARIGASSPNGNSPGWDLVGLIVKSNDDLRQEAFVMQLIELCKEAFEMAGLELWLHPYRILATGRTTGIIEMVHNAMSFDSLKKRPGYEKGRLRGHFQKMAEFAADPKDAYVTAQRNFVRSLASYSLMSYLFLFKDRHNGNILLDTAGHVIHIDFGFVFGIAPGGSFSLEQSVPFKLTEEMLELMGGLGSPLFSEFVTLFCCGFLALQAHMDTFLTMVEITCEGSSFKCFEGKDSMEIVSKLRDRFCPNLNKEATVAYALDLIKFAISSYGTKQYDYFQYLSQGIAT